MPFCLSSYFLDRTRNLCPMGQSKGLCLSARRIDCLENLGSVAVLVVENTFGKTESSLNEKVRSVDHPGTLSQENN